MSFPNTVHPIIKLTENCNYDCFFCRYSKKRRQDKGIPETIIKKIITECISYNKSNNINHINIVFHGGEPLLYGKDNLLSILEYIDSSFPETNTEYSIQTNASLITHDWISIFKKYNFDVGISLDGPIGLNAHGKSLGEEAIKNAVENYHILRNNGVRCGFLSVITNDHLDQLDYFFNFFINNQIDSVGLCYSYSKTDKDYVDAKRLGEWLIQLYELYYNSSSRIVIREFDNVTRRIINKLRNPHDLICRKNCGRYLTFTPDGKVSFCDDYIPDDINDCIIGNITTQSIFEIINSNAYKRSRDNVLKIVEQKCHECNVVHMCRGGCARNDSLNNNYFCETYKILYPYMEDKICSYLKSKNHLPENN